MIDKKVIAAIVAFCVAFTLATWRKSEMEIRIAEANAKVEIANAERENAIQLSEQYKRLYEESLQEVAALKEMLAIKNQLEKEISWDYDYVVRVVGAEARGEPWEGKLAVCQCIQETAERTGKTPYEVVQKGYADPVGCETLDGMEEVNEACLLVFLNGYKPFKEPIQYFYSTRNGFYSKWHESQDFCYEIGSHRFFKEAGR